MLVLAGPNPRIMKQTEGGLSGLVFWVTRNLKQWLCTALISTFYCALKISVLAFGIHFTSL